MEGQQMAKKPIKATPGVDKLVPADSPLNKGGYSPKTGGYRPSGSEEKGYKPPSASTGQAPPLPTNNNPSGQAKD